MARYKEDLLQTLDRCRYSIERLGEDPSDWFRVNMILHQFRDSASLGLKSGAREAGAFEQSGAACPNCAGYNYTRITIDGNKCRCDDCGKKYRYLDYSPPSPALVDPMSTSWRWPLVRTDTAGNTYEISRDCHYDRKWVLNINLLGSEFWMFYGAFWFKRSAMNRARSFELMWDVLLKREGFRKRHLIPDSVVVKK